MRLPLLTGLLLLAATQTALADPLAIEVCGARPAVPVSIAVFASAAAFAAQTAPAANLILQPDDKGNGRLQADLPPGTYAIAAFQDLDGDGALTTNFLGLPVEPFGFSGDSDRLGPPGFATAAFMVPAAAPALVCLREL